MFFFLSPNFGGSRYCVLWSLVAESAIRTSMSNNAMVNLYSRAAVVDRIPCHDSLVVKSRVLNHLRIVHSRGDFARHARITLHVKVIKSRRREVCILRSCKQKSEKYIYEINVLRDVSKSLSSCY